MKQAIRSCRKTPQILNLFAYSGGATLAAAQAGARVCHVDASKGMVAWARENASYNQLKDAPIRWIVDDAVKFLKREIKRGTRYEGIILDPPSFGRGTKERFLRSSATSMNCSSYPVNCSPKTLFFCISQRIRRE